MRIGPGTTTALLAGAALVPFLVVGCSKKNSETIQTSSTTTGATTTVVSPASPGASGGEVAGTNNASWNDANIVALLDESDHGEVQLARLAQQKATSSKTREFARMLIRDHTTNDRALMSLEKKLSLTPAAPANDTSKDETQHLVQQYTSMPAGMSFDSAFVQHEIDDHQQDLTAVKQMQGQATDAQLKQLLDNTLPVIQKHLDAAQTLIGQLGSNASGMSSSDTGAMKPRHGRTKS